MATEISIKRYNNFKVVADYDNDNGNDVTNTLNVGIYVGLTKTDGETEDEQYKTFVGPNETTSFESGLGSGRKIIVYRQVDKSTLCSDEIFAE